MSANSSKARREVSALLRQFFNKRVKLPPGQWAEKNIRLTHRQSNLTGLYSLDNTPFFRRLYEDVANRDVKTIILQKSAQIGASLFNSIVLIYYICNENVPIACIFPSQEMAKQFSERNLHPAIESTEAIKEFLTGDIDDIRRTEFIFKSCTLKIIGGGSASKLSSNPIAVVIIDEADKYQSIPGEANPLELAFDRTLSFQETGDSKIIITSTPTIEHSSLVYHRYLEGSQSKYHVPCPHCNHKQPLEFEQIKFGHCKEGEVYNLDRVQKESFYQCIKCSGKITNDHKPGILNKGEWIDDNPNAPSDTRSYHISALYSLFLSFGAIARMFLEAKDDRSRLQNFYNSILGKPWKPTAATVSISAIDKLIELSPEYTRGEIPSRPLALVLGVDTQQVDFPFVTLAILENGGCALVDYGYAPSFDDLYDLSNQQYRLKGTDEYFGIYGCIIDGQGNRTSSVYDFGIQTGGKFMPCFGRGTKHRLFTPVSKSVINYKDYSIPILNVNDKIFSDILLMEVLKFRKQILYLPVDSSDELKNQLTAVSIVEKKDKNGFVTFEYESKRQNHYFDCLKYSYALRYLLLPTLEEIPEQPQEAPQAKLEQPQQYWESAGSWS